MEIVYAIIRAVIAHLYLAWIHPFGDGNGRTARLLEFSLLLDSGVPAPAAHLLSNHYNHTRTEYYRQLDQASKSGGNVLPFLAYAIEGFRDGLREQVDRIRKQQWDVAWRNYVHESFSHQNSTMATRQRHLILDLSDSEKPVPGAKLIEISPRVMASYSKKTSKTLSRDLNALSRMRLIERVLGGFVARKRAILAFLPHRAKPH